MAEQACNPFSSSSSETDLVLLVEEEKLHVSKVVLSLVSPVFKTMLEGDYKEKHSSEIALPEKKFEDVLQFLLCVYPSTAEPVTRRNLDCVLPLAEEYCVQSLKKRCGAFILSQFQHPDPKISNPCNYELVHFTLLADMYKLEACVEACVDKLVYRHYDGNWGTKELEEFELLSSDVKFQILEKRLCLVEKPCRDILNSVRNVDAGDIKKNLTDPSCPGCKIPDRRHRFDMLCRYNASKVSADVIEKSSRLNHCFKTGDE